MKLSNCGRCGLEPVVTVEEYLCDEGPGVEYARCPVGHVMKPTGQWNAAQFAARTERINAAAVALMAGDWASDGVGTSPEQVVFASVMLIDAQDVAARVRWAEMQKGE